MNETLTNIATYPTPWEVDADPAEGDGVQVVDAIGGKVCEMDGFAPASRLNAELIVRAVNRLKEAESEAALLCAGSAGAAPSAPVPPVSPVVGDAVPCGPHPAFDRKTIDRKDP